ncbi:hypothetical protein NBRC116594_11660 [Shimia sp. NS0008-38b]
MQSRFFEIDCNTGCKIVHDPKIAQISTLGRACPLTPCSVAVVVIEKGFDLGFDIAGQEVVLQQDAVLQSLMTDTKGITDPNVFQAFLAQSN